MSSLIILGIIAGGLFLLLFITKRRLGAVGLALVAGSVLANLGAQTASKALSNAGVTFTAFPLEQLVTALLVIVPALFVLPGSPAYHTKLLRLVGSIVFAGLGVGLLLGAIEGSVIIDKNGVSVYNFLSQNRSLFIIAGVVAALVDLFFTRAHTPSKHLDKH